MFFTIKLCLHLNCVLILNWIVWNRTICIKMNLALNNLQRLICHKTQTKNQPTNREKSLAPLYILTFFKQFRNTDLKRTTFVFARHFWTFFFLFATESKNIFLKNTIYARETITLLPNQSYFCCVWNHKVKIKRWISLCKLSFLKTFLIR